MKGYTLNLTAKTLTITKAFNDAVSKGEGEAYELYTKFMRDIPGLTVISKTHKTPTKYVSKSTGEKFNCNQFKNLKYENMEGFINGLSNSEDYMKSYLFLKNCGSLPLTSRYTAVRRWFVAQFPNFRKDPLFYLYNKVDVIEATPFFQQAKEEAAEKVAKKAMENAEEVA
ncbi:hypothetical protein JQM60_00440 [Butyricicoccus pullicaecorum]|nr:hypothetical protein [Butyricicoccus pullicaecorum]